MLLARFAFLFQTSSLAKPLYCVQSGLPLPFLSRPILSQATEPLTVYGNRYPLPAASFATGTPVRLLPENSIIHNQKYFVLCIEVTPSRCRTIVPVRGDEVSVPP